MKRYVATRTGHSARDRGRVEVIVVIDDLVPVPLQHRMRHSPDGFEWGYGGSGPSDLARSILWDYFGAEPHPACYQDFKFHFVAPASVDGFVVSEPEIDQWLAGWRDSRRGNRGTACATLYEEAQEWARGE